MPKFCPECGAEQKSENNHFCSNCGFDFSKLENNQMGVNSSSLDDSSVNIPINSDSYDSSSTSRTKTTGSTSSSRPTSSSVGSSSSTVPPKTTTSSTSSSRSTTTSSTTSSRPTTSSTSSSRSTTSNASNPKYKTKTVNFLDGLTFNKCFLAFAVLLILLLIIGMMAQKADTEPSSDRGLTSFMESSGGYDLSSSYDTSYDDYYSDEYLQYGGDGESNLPYGNSNY